MSEPQTPKQVAIISQNGHSVVVARTYDEWAPTRQGEFSLQFQNAPIVPRSPIHDRPIYRDSYQTLKHMVERAYPTVEWLDAAQYNL